MNVANSANILILIIYVDKSKNSPGQQCHLFILFANMYLLLSFQPIHIYTLST